MKIAFVGKGGSGKSTSAALFIDYLVKKRKPVIAVDADINVHLPALIGAEMKPTNALSSADNATAIKQYLHGNNKHIAASGQIIKTTPPSHESNFLTADETNQIIRTFASQFADRGYLFHFGTYEEEGIGNSCYHADLAIFESILSHTLLREDEYLVADMAAGTDAFAGSLHAQFDAVFLVVEPSPEGVAVFEQYMQLARAGGVSDYVYVIGNKIEDEDDLAYLKEHVEEKLVGHIAKQAELKRARQKGGKIDSSVVNGVEETFEKLTKIATTNYSRQDERLALLHRLHKKLAKAEYIVTRHGDVAGQIDTEFSYQKALQGFS